MTESAVPGPPSPDPYGDAVDWNATWMARKKRHVAIPGFREGPGFFQQPANVARFAHLAGTDRQTNKENENVEAFCRVEE